LNKSDAKSLIFSIGKKTSRLTLDKPDDAINRPGLLPFFYAVKRVAVQMLFNKNTSYIFHGGFRINKKNTALWFKTSYSEVTHKTCG